MQCRLFQVVSQVSTRTPSLLLSRNLSFVNSPIKKSSLLLNHKKNVDFSGSQRSFWTFGNKKPRRMKTTSEKNKTTLLYLTSLCVLTVGASYAAVPLYRIFCRTSGYGGTTQQVSGHDAAKVEELVVKKDRKLTIKFIADTAASMQWNFRPQQPQVQLFAGETALAFYTARNPTDKPIDGISTYNVVPYEAGQYFNKIQCFCFEEQRLNPGEEVDMPVFFYIDPDFMEDPFLENVDTIYLSYTFFESKPGLTLPNMPYHNNKPHNR